MFALLKKLFASEENTGVEKPSLGPKQPTYELDDPLANLTKEPERRGELLAMMVDSGAFVMFEGVMPQVPVTTPQELLEQTPFQAGKVEVGVLMANDFSLTRVILNPRSTHETELFDSDFAQLRRLAYVRKNTLESEQK